MSVAVPIGLALVAAVLYACTISAVAKPAGDDGEWSDTQNGGAVVGACCVFILVFAALV